MKQCYKRIFAAVLCVVLCLGMFGITASANAASVTVSSSGSGAVASGSGSLATGAVPLLSYVAAAGVSIYSVNGIITELTRMYEMLSQEVKAELIEIANSGDATYTLSSSLASSLAEAYNMTFVDSNGTFREFGLTFDSSGMLAYNYDAQYYYGSVYPTSTVCTTHITESPVTIPGTSLTAALTNCEGEYGGKWLTIHNTVTGIEVSMVNGTMYDWLNHDHCNYFISQPTVISTSTNAECVGYWVMKVCNLLGNGEACNDCYAAYSNAFISLNPDAVVGGYAMVRNTGQDLIDGFLLNGQICNGIDNWSWVKESDGSICADVPVDIGSAAVCDDTPYAIDYADVATPAVDDVLYLPTTRVLEDIGLLTYDYAKNGTLDDTGTDTGTDTDTDANTGFWSTLWSWLERILDAIVNGFQSVIDAIKGLAWKFTDTDLLDFAKSMIDIIRDFLLGLKELVFDRVATIALAVSDWFQALFHDVLGFFQGDDTTNYNAFFEFMRNLWQCLPTPVTSFIIFAFSTTILFAVLKMFW